jgi:prolyl oligopeptidase
MKLRASTALVISTVCAAILAAGGPLPLVGGPLIGARLGAQSARIPAYPPTHRGAQSDIVGGVRVADPYRWLEDVGTPEVHAWAAEQTALTRSYLDQLPRHDDLAAAISRASSFPRWSVPTFGGERSFYAQADGVANQSVLFVQDRRDLPVRMLLDPNAYSAEGFIAIVDDFPSPDGRYLAYEVSTQGSSWRSVRIRDVRANQDLPEELHGVWGADAHLAWTGDSRGFVYVRADAGRAPGTPLAPRGREQLYFHRAGQSQSSDRLVYERADHPDWRVRGDVSEDGQYLVITTRVRAALANRMYLIDLDNPSHPNFGAPLVTVYDAGDAEFEFVANEGPVFYVRTTKGSPRGRVVAVDINLPGEEHWTTVVRETYDPLVGVTRADDRLVANRIHDAHSALDLYALDGVARGSVPLPGAGTVRDLRAHGRELFFEYSSFTQPPSVYRYDLDNRTAGVYREPTPDTTLAAFETTQLFFASGDGTRVPMFITARRGITLDGTHPTLLAVDGAFADASTPAFSPFVLAWLQLGGIYAMANVRGGGEYGRLWHEAATSSHKSVSVDDFVAAAAFLADQRYTRAALLGAVGRGAGGLVAAAAIVRRPELFGAAAFDDGLFDMARFDRYAAAADWTPEFGSPLDPSSLRALLDYSPLNTVRAETTYPPLLLSAGERDDYVSPANSYKLAAALQAAQGGSAVDLLLVEPDMGHGPGNPRSRQVSLDADRLRFLAGILRGLR